MIQKYKFDYVRDEAVVAAIAANSKILEDIEEVHDEPAVLHENLAPRQQLDISGMLDNLRWIVQTDVSTIIPYTDISAVIPHTEPPQIAQTEISTIGPDTQPPDMYKHLEEADYSSNLEDDNEVMVGSGDDEKPKYRRFFGKTRKPKASAAPVPLSDDVDEPLPEMSIHEGRQDTFKTAKLNLDHYLTATEPMFKKQDSRAPPPVTENHVNREQGAKGHPDKQTARLLAFMMRSMRRKLCRCT